MMYPHHMEMMNYQMSSQQTSQMVKCICLDKSCNINPPALFASRNCKRAGCGAPLAYLHFWIYFGIKNIKCSQKEIPTKLEECDCCAKIKNEQTYGARGKSVQQRICSFVDLRQNCRKTNTELDGSTGVCSASTSVICGKKLTQSHKKWLSSANQVSL